jgi:hypothetical protein
VSLRERQALTAYGGRHTNADRSTEPDCSDFTSFEGEVEPGQVLILPEKGEWRVESVEQTPDLRLPRLVCVSA